MNSDFYELLDSLEQNARDGEQVLARAVKHQWVSRDLMFLMEELNGIWMGVNLLTRFVAYAMQDDDNELLAELFRDTDLGGGDPAGDMVE